MLELPATWPLFLRDLSGGSGEGAKCTHQLGAIWTWHSREDAADLRATAICHVLDNAPTVIAQVEAYFAPIASLPTARDEPFGNKAVAKPCGSRRIYAQCLCEVDRALRAPRCEDDESAVLLERDLCLVI